MGSTCTKRGGAKVVAGVDSLDAATLQKQVASEIKGSLADRMMQNSRSDMVRLQFGATKCFPTILLHSQMGCTLTYLHDLLVDS